MRNVKSNLTFHFTFALLAIISLYACAAGADYDEAMEKEVIQQAQEQANAQLKDYFKEHYLKEGKDHYNKGQYKEAYAKFKRALYWSPDFKPVMQYMQMAESKIVEDYLKKNIDKLILGESSVSAEDAPAQEQYGSAYRIGPGDTLEVLIGGHPELSRELVVRSDGTIYFPPAGSMRVGGLSLSGAELEIAKGLNKSVKDPQVAVTVSSFGK